MSDNNVIKSIVSQNCPHCGKEIFIESQMVPPTINALFTMDDVKKAKEDCIVRIGTLSIDEEKKSSVTKWLNDPNTVFGPTEVESIILSLLQPQE